jgi:hypothetical protein
LAQLQLQKRVRRRDAAQLLFLSCLSSEKQKCRFLSRPSLRTVAPPCLPLDIKDLLKEDVRVLAFGFVMGKAFWMWEDCWREIAKGENELLKGKC